MELSRRFTADDLRSLPDDDLPHELWRGELRLVSAASSLHGAVCSRVLAALTRHVYEHQLGELFTESTGFLLERDPDTLLCPDVAFVSRGSLPAGALGSGFMELAPDLAVEVLSPSDRPKMVRTRVARFLSLGVRTIWVIKSSVREVHVHTASVEAMRLTERDSLDGAPVLPGFRCPVAQLFPPRP